MSTRRWHPGTNVTCTPRAETTSPRILVVVTFSSGAQLALVLDHVVGELEPACLSTDITFEIEAQCVLVFEPTPPKVCSQSNEGNDSNQPHELPIKEK